MQRSSFTQREVKESPLPLKVRIKPFSRDYFLKKARGGFVSRKGAGVLYGSNDYRHIGGFWCFRGNNEVAKADIYAEEHKGR